MENETVRNDWYFAEGVHTGHRSTDFLHLPPTVEDRAEGAGRDASHELEHALASLRDRWDVFAGQRNLLLEDTWMRLDKRCQRAAEAFWAARTDLLGREFCDPRFCTAFEVLARIALTRSRTLEWFPARPSEWGRGD